MTPQSRAAARSPVGDRAEYWEQIYRSRSGEQLSWTQPEPVMSLRLVEQLPIQREAAIVDIGAGESTLVDALLARGYQDLTVPDLT